MTFRDRAPLGAPTWADLWTPDVPTARRFYGEFFGWEATEPAEEFGGYFTFTRDGAPVAGAMGDMPDMPAANIWSVYFATDDAEKTLAAAQAEGGEVRSPAMAVGDLGVQGLLADPNGAPFGVWQPVTFHGFSTLGEPGTPNWFELHTRNHAAALKFYRSVFQWEVSGGSDTDEFRYAVMRGRADNPGDADQTDIVGIMDSTAFLRDDEAAHWDIYWHVEDMSDAVARLRDLGGSVVFGPDATPYGDLAVVTDPVGAQFKLRVPPRG
jgi:predicted enzyme related to lactoylglutathione lyase